MIASPSNPLLEICRILLLHEIERNRKTAESESLDSSADSTATSQATEATQRVYSTRKRRAGQNSEAQR